ncbi:MAG: CoA transferase, partial [Verrucomicrobiota bacterium]|nr:CoA transferase [Verrucomicrobiota bacterium]
TYWAERLDAAGVPNAPLQDLAQAVAHEQTAASGILQTSPDGNYRVVGLPLKFDGLRPAFQRPAPGLGEADEDLL